MSKFCEAKNLLFSLVALKLLTASVGPGFWINSEINRVLRYCINTPVY